MSSGEDLSNSARVRGVPLLRAPIEHDHIVQFYNDPDFLGDVVADFLAAGLATGESLVVIATAQHRAIFAQSLTDRGVDLQRVGDFVTWLDARQTLASFMRQGMPDGERFFEVLSAALDRSSARTEVGRTRAYGEMVDLLWQDGMPAAAIRLEGLWTELGRRLPLTLLCAYSLGNFREHVDGQPFADVCRAHSHVYPTEGYFDGSDDQVRFREIARLQQRARAVESAIEQKQRAEEALLEALQVRDDFLALAGHELRTPVTALKLHLQMMLRAATRGGDPGDAAGLARALRYVDRVVALTEELSDVARLGAARLALNPEPVELAALVAESLDRIVDTARSVGCALRMTADAQVQGHWDRGRIEQVVDNLLSNALKYGSGMPVAVDVRRREQQAVLVVSDEGIGIAAQDQARIFERFERVHRGASSTGLGLGLWIVREIVRAHGGTIRVESERGRGSRFVVELPLRAP